MIYFIFQRLELKITRATREVYKLNVVLFSIQYGFFSVTRIIEGFFEQKYFSKTTEKRLEIFLIIKYRQRISANFTNIDIIQSSKSTFQLFIDIEKLECFVEFIAFKIKKKTSMIIHTLFILFYYHD